MIVRNLLVILSINIALSFAYFPHGALSRQNDEPDDSISTSFNSTPTSVYANQIDLVPGKYRFYWNLTNERENDSDLIGELHLRSHGWMGFGFSPSGKMRYSDVIIAWVQKNGSAYFTVIKYNLSFLRFRAA